VASIRVASERENVHSIVRVEEHIPIALASVIGALPKPTLQMELDFLDDIQVMRMHPRNLQKLRLSPSQGGNGKIQRVTKIRGQLHTAGNVFPIENREIVIHEPMPPNLLACVPSYCEVRFFD